MSEERVVLVTGASSGLGRETAALLARKGHRVFGTSRRAGSPAAPGFEMLALDVRDEGSTRRVVAEVVARAGRLDVLVNNAGTLLTGAVEETTVHEAVVQLDTNFMGVVRMVAATLPRMRRQGGGHIITIGSLAGLIGVPFEAFYSATKHALEGYSEALRAEVAGFGIWVSIVEAGFFKSGLAQHKTTPAHALPEYAATKERVDRAFDRSMGQGIEAGEVAATFARIVAARAPRLRYRVGSDARWVPRLKWHLPERMFQEGMRRRFDLDR